MSNAPKKLSTEAQSSPTRTVVVKLSGDDCVKPVEGGCTESLVVRNPAPAASPASSPTRSEKFVVMC